MIQLRDSWCTFGNSGPSGCSSFTEEGLWWLKVGQKFGTSRSILTLRSPWICVSGLSPLILANELHD
jgi:hypothetical protein